MSDPTEIEANALDVMDAALAGESPTSTDGLSTEGTSVDVDPPDEGVVADEALADAEKVVADEDPTGAGRQRDPATGKFLPKGQKLEAKAEEIDPATGKPKVEAAKVAEIDPLTGKPKVEAKKEADPINDPLPKDMKQETRARVEKLIEIAKTEREEKAQVQQSLDTLVGVVQATGSTPEQYGELLSWMGLFNSQEPAQKEKALELAQNVVERLSTMLGKPVNYNNPITGHADLIAEMQANKLTPQRAMEIAIQRNQQKLNGDMQQHQQGQLDQKQQLEQAQDQAKTALTALGESLKATDPQYQEKKDRILPALRVAFESVHPSQWKGMFERAYRNVVLPKAAAPAAVVPRNQPLRGNRNGTGGSGSPVTPVTDPLAVMNAALDSMR